MSDGPNVALRLEALGTLRVWNGKDEVATFVRQPMRAALLFHMALERRTTRSSLLALLWPDRDEAKGRHALAQTVYEIRQELGSDVLETMGDHLTIDESVSVDALEFEQAVEARKFDRAAELYGGPFLQGVYLCDSRDFEGWVDGKQARLSRLYRMVQRERVAAFLEAGDHEPGIEASRAWVAADPLEDEAHHALIELLHLNGRRVEALEQYETYRERLERELEVEPLEETQALVEKIKRGPVVSPTAAPVPKFSGTPISPARSKAAGDGGESPAGAEDLDARVSRGLAPELEVVRTVGEGSMGRVYLAREPALARLVAVKVLRASLVHDAVALQRFRREAQSAARILHPNVVTVHRTGTLPSGEPYLVMPYFRGGSLAERVEATGPLSVEECRSVLLQVARGLEAAHRIGVVHRDLKPGNVLRSGSGDQVLLTDFGIAALLESGDASDARLTLPGMKVGSARYSSPEQLQGDVLTERADVYGLGLLAFEILTGNSVFPTGNEVALISAHLQEEAPNLSESCAEVDHDLGDLVARCLRKRPEYRPTAGDVIAELESHREGD